MNNIFKPIAWSMTVLLAAMVAGCGGSTAAAGPGLGPTGTTCTGTGCVNLGTAGNYAILAKTGVDTIPNSVVTGNVGVSPVARVGLTGWSLITEPTDTSFGSAQVAAPGRLFAADQVGGATSVNLTTAVADMETAYTTANGGAAGAACPGTDFGGLTITAGVYDCAVNVGIATSTTLDGTGVFVFRITGNLTQAAATLVNLTGGAVAQNVFWVVSGSVDIGTTATMKGVILGKTAINVATLATVNGRLLAQTAVNLDQATVTQP
ncbi:MAG: ice-binding family protein [Sideroxyarcus sp.]|nr:ice-binding family protein [Sideroxyarcus sp.]